MKKKEKRMRESIPLLLKTIKISKKTQWTLISINSFISDPLLKPSDHLDELNGQTCHND